MGFDLYGIHARSRKGEYFRNNIGWWRALAIYVLENVPMPSRERKDWHVNNGQQISKATAIRIARALDRLIKEGHTAQYQKAYEDKLKHLPPDECTDCKGSGRTNDSIRNDTCQTCLGKGYLPDWDTECPFNVENVKEFADFCRDSGGFVIW